MRTSDKAKHVMKMFDVLRRRGCLNIVQQTSKFPPMADKRLINVTVDSSATEKPLLPANLFSKSTLPCASIYTVNSFNTQCFKESAIQFILTAIAPAATHPG